MAQESEGEPYTEEDATFFRDTMRRHRAHKKLQAKEIVFEPSTELAAKLASHSQNKP